MFSYPKLGVENSVFEVCFPAQDQKKRSALKISPVFGPKLGEDQKKGLHSTLVWFLAQIR